MGTDRFEVEEVAFVGRTFEEYRHMFDLSEADLRGESVLDCPGGAGSFVATAAERGIDATAVDVMYDRPPAELAECCRADAAALVEQLPEKRDLFVWEFYDDIADRAAYFERAHDRFLADYPAGRTAGRYCYGELPTLPFPDGAFSVVLSAHLLFLFGDRFDYEFHVASLREFARVARDEVRVFPLTGLDTAPYDRLGDVIEALDADGYGVERRPVPFEFQQGATEMLVVTV